MHTLTPKQKIVLHAIKSYFAKYGQMPSIRQLRNEIVHQGLDIKSPRSVFIYLNHLEEKGLIKRVSKDRGIQLVGDSETSFIDIPVLGMANAGSPTMVAEENVEGYLKVSRRLYGSNKLFAIRISGDSMNSSSVKGKNIGDGDYVIVDQGYKDFQNGDKVLVVIDGLATVKTYRQVESGVIGLFPESNNKIHQPIYLTPDDDFIINGKVIDVLKTDN